MHDRGQGTRVPTAIIASFGGFSQGDVDYGNEAVIAVAAHGRQTAVFEASSLSQTGPHEVASVTLRACAGRAAADEASGGRSRGAGRNRLSVLKTQ